MSVVLQHRDFRKFIGREVKSEPLRYRGQRRLMVDGGGGGGVISSPLAAAAAIRQYSLSEASPRQPNSLANTKETLCRVPDVVFQSALPHQIRASVNSPKHKRKMRLFICEEQKRLALKLFLHVVRNAVAGGIDGSGEGS